MITRTTQLAWNLRALHRIGTPEDIAQTGWMHAPPAAETIARASVAATRAFEMGLPIEDITAVCRESPSVKATSGGYVWGDLPAAVCLRLGRFWTKKHRALWITFETDSEEDEARAFEANYTEEDAWQAPFTETLWPRITAWLKGGQAR
jgi:hypothetical protein